MKTKAIIALLIILPMVVPGLRAQDWPILTDQLVLPAKKSSQKHYSEYEVGYIKVFVIDDKNEERFYIIDTRTGEKIYDYTEGEERAMHLKPRFYMAEGQDNPIIICMSLETTYSLGTYVFIVDDGKVYFPGFIEFGADNFNFSAIGLYAQFEQHGDWFLMFFQDDVKLIDYVTDDLLYGNQIEFKIERDKITPIRK